MVDFRPSLDEALLRPRKAAANALDRIQSERGQGVLIERVKMRPMVRRTDLHEHSNDDSEEPRQFRHGDTLHRPSRLRRANANVQPQGLQQVARGARIQNSLAGCNILLGCTWAAPAGRG